MLTELIIHEGVCRTASATLGLLIINKPAAQAAGADTSQCKSTNTQIHPFSKMAVTFEPPMRF